MKFFIDTEFIESGNLHPIQLISIGIVAEDGRNYYAISSEFDSSKANSWVHQNVLRTLEPSALVPRLTVRQIATALQTFVGTGKPEFWGYYSDYDWVVFCQIAPCNFVQIAGDRRTNIMAATRAKHSLFYIESKRLG